MAWHSFDRYEVQGLSSAAAVLRGRTSGIYVLEFSTGEEYVGQTVHFSRRVAEHRHGGRHHQPWDDIVAIRVMDMAAGDLDDGERRTIRECLAAKKILRNRTFNFGSQVSSAFDEVMPVQDQAHWATGGAAYDVEVLRQASLREHGSEPALYGSRLGRERAWPGDEQAPSKADLVVHALALLVSDVVPNAVELEGEYWTVSDYPSTAGGRFATLNAGRLELAYFPREAWWVVEDEVDDVELTPVVLNFAPGTFLPADAEPFVEFPSEFGESVTIMRAPHALTQVDSLQAPLVDFVKSYHQWGLASNLRPFVLDLMRSGPSGIFRRFHSTELARRIYAVAAALPAQPVMIDA